MKNHYRFWIVFSLIIVFTAGIVGGVLLEKYVIDKKPAKLKNKQGSVHFPTLDDIAKELDLSADQKEEIREIFKNTEESFKGLRSHFFKQLSKMRSELIKEIKSMLNEKQNTKFDIMVEKYLSQREEQMKKRKKYPEKFKNEKGDEK